MRNMYVLLTFSILFIAFLSNCQSGDGHVTEVVESTSTPDEVFNLPTQTDVQNHPVNEPVPGFWRIIEGDATDIWWKQDSTKLFIALSSGDHFEYDVVDEEAKKITTDILHPETPHPDLAQQLPSNAQDLGISPSREKALYVIPIGPTPTPPSMWTKNIDVPAQLWLWQNEQSELIGEIYDCVYGYQWSANDEKVIVFSFPDPECKNSSATLVDLKTSSLVPLFPEYLWTELKCCALSPNSRYLIYVIDYELFTLDSQSFSTSIINAPAHSYITAIWVDNSRLLAIYFDDKSDPATYGILDLGTGEMEDLFTRGDEFLGGEYILNYTISPDGQWMAFTIGETTNTTNAVWVMKLPDK